ncbi:MAG: VCBS repeat-containing protein [Candidatus Eisenbacteria bacterium]
MNGARIVLHSLMVMLAGTSALAETTTLPLDQPVPYELGIAEPPFDLVDRPHAVYLVGSETGRILAELPVLELGSVLEGLSGQPLDVPTPRSELPPGVTEVEGWPVALPALPSGTPAAADLDGDGREEIVLALVDGSLYVFDGDGTVRPGWPKQLGDPIRHGPRVADLDEDGRLEILVATEAGFAHAIGLDGGRAARMAGVYRCRPADRAGVGRADDRGTPPPPGPRSRPGRYGRYGAGLRSRRGSPPRLARACATPDARTSARLLRAGRKRGSGWRWRPRNHRRHGPGSVVAYRADGRRLRGWPAILPGAARAGFGPVVVSDLDGGGGPEIVVASDRGEGNGAKLSVLRPDGRPVSGWPASSEAA